MHLLDEIRIVAGIADTPFGIAHALAVTVVAAPDFSLSANPNTLSIAQGSSGNSTITITPLTGFSGNVNISGGTFLTGGTITAGVNSDQFYMDGITNTISGPGGPITPEIYLYSLNGSGTLSTLTSDSPLNGGVGLRTNSTYACVFQLGSV
ncbi:hypothetical protein B4Q13_21290, partial [Lacticaseibacillus rhamnosus]